MINYIFKNTNNSIAFYALKAARQLKISGASFRIIFDKEYDIFLQDNLVCDSFYTNSDRHIFDSFILKDNNVLLDFDLDFSISGFSCYEDYILFKLFDEEKNLDSLNISTKIDQKITVEQILQDNNRNNFSYVLFAPYNLDVDFNQIYTHNDLYYDASLRSFYTEHVEKICSYLTSKVNLITVLPSSNSINLNELSYLVQKSHFVISTLDIAHVLAVEYNKPCFVNLGRFTGYKPKNENVTIFDPERNNKKIIPSSFFAKDFETSLEYNNKILEYDVDLLQKEIINSLDKNQIAYQS